MSVAEIESVISEAQSCAEGECAIDEVESLITNLQGQQSLLSKRIEEISGLIKELEHVNGQDERPVDEVRETVRAIFRIFSLGVSNIIDCCSFGTFRVHDNTPFPTISLAHDV